MWILASPRLCVGQIILIVDLQPRCFKGFWLQNVTQITLPIANHRTAMKTTSFSGTYTVILNFCHLGLGSLGSLGSLAAIWGMVLGTAQAASDPSEGVAKKASPDKGESALPNHPCWILLDSDSMFQKQDCKSLRQHWWHKRLRPKSWGARTQRGAAGLIEA